MALSDDRIIRERLAKLRQEHRELDARAADLEVEPVRDELQIRRLKKQKLILKDEMAQLEDKLVPDIIA